MRTVKKRWDSILAVLLAAAGAYFAPVSEINNITTELVAFFGIQSTIILPTMIFSAGILKPEGLEISEAKKYHKALKKQMQFWVTLISLEFITIFALLVGKFINWNIVIVYDMTWILIFVIFFAGSLAVIRIISFVRGIQSLLELNVKFTIKAIKYRKKAEAESRRQRIKDLPKLQLPDGHGNYSD